MTESDAIKLFKCLADKSRLMILKNLIKEPIYVELLAEKLNLSASTVSFHLKKLEDAGIVNSKKEQYYTIYSVNKEMLSYSVLDIINEKDFDISIQDQREAEYRKKVIDNFFEYGKLKQIPVQRKKRLIVLEEIAKSFEVNKKYTEKEVNIIIADYNDDFCTIRREFIAENIMKRENGIYERMEI